MAESASKHEIISSLLPVIRGTRDRRKAVENEWLLSYRAWQGWPSQSYMLPLPDNSIHYFIPFARRAIERDVARIVKLLMPNQEWHQTLPFDGESHENAEAVHQAMRYFYQKKIPTKKNIGALARCLKLYGFASQHTSVRIQRKEVWPFQRVVDPFNFYVFPDTASDESEALVMFEDVVIPYQVYRSYVDRDNPKSSIYEDISSSELSTPEWPYHLIERLAYKGLSQPSDFISGVGSDGPRRSMTDGEMRLKVNQARADALATLSRDSSTFVQLTKAYFRVGAYWFYVVLCTNVKAGDDVYEGAKIVRLDEAENTPMYRWTTARSLPNELYTNGAMDDIRVLQNLANNAISDVEANRAQVQTNPIAMDAREVGRVQEDVWGTRKIWKVNGDPNQLIKSIDVEDVSTNGIRAWQIYLGLIDKNSGGTLAEGQPGRNMPRAGFATQNLLNMALVETEDSADTIETDILTPGLGDVYHCLLEYVPDRQLVKIPSKRPELIKAYRKRDLYGDYSFSWLGSLGFQDAQQRADKFTQFFGTLFNPQVLQLLMQQLQQEGMTLNIRGLLEQYYSYGLGERNLGDIIIPMSAQQKAAMQQPSPEQQQMHQDMQMKQAELQMKQQEHQQKLQQADQQFRGKMAVEAQKGRLDLQKQQGEFQLKQQEQQTKLIDIHARRQEAMMNALRPMNDTRNGTRRTSNE